MFTLQLNQPLSDEAVAKVRSYLAWPPFKQVIWANPFKHRYVFPLEADGRRMIVKVYHHCSLHYRLAARFGRSYADRYYSHALQLASMGVAVPAPVMLMKWGPGALPHQTLFVMEEIEGREMRDLLGEIEQDKARIALLAERVATIINGLARAGVSHRDLNAKNFLVSANDAVTLIDLDSATKHAPGGRTFQRKHERDVAHFLAACKDAPTFAEAVRGRLENASG